MQRFTGPSGRLPPEQGHFYALPIRGTPWGRGRRWANTGCAGSRRRRSPSHPREPRGVPPRQAGHPIGDPPPRSSVQSPLPYPVFVLANLLHLKSLGTLALGHLPGDLPSPTKEVRDQDFGSLPQYKALLRQHTALSSLSFKNTVITVSTSCLF